VTNLLGPNLVGDQQAQTWSIGALWRALETWLPLEELRDLHILYLIKPSHKYYYLYIVYPMCLLAVTCSSLPYIVSYLPLCVLLVLYQVCVCICCASYLLILCTQVCLGCLAHHLLCLEPLMPLYDILFGSFRVINGTSHFGGVICFVHLSFLKMCVHEYYHLVLILQNYLVTMWYVMLMRNSNSRIPLIISS
jgi:hypothetical protein